jgi:hypothetical protein
MPAQTAETPYRDTEMAASTRAGIVVSAYISGQVDVLNNALARVQRHDPDAVGRTRTSIYKVRTAFRGYRHLFVRIPHGGPQLDQLLAALKHTHELETLRTHFADRFDQLGLTIGEYPRWYGALGAEQRDAYDHVEAVGTQPWVAVLLSQVRLFTEHPQFTRDGDKPASSLMDVLSRAKIHLLDTYVKLSHTADPAAAYEETRVVARETRYLAEAVEPALGRAAADVITPVSRLQHLLLQYRESAVARHWLQRLPGAARADDVTISLADLETEHLRQTSADIDRAVSSMVKRWTD